MKQLKIINFTRNYETRQYVADFTMAGTVTEKNRLFVTTTKTGLNFY